VVENVKYTKDDAGCYFDSSSTDEIVDFARDHGAIITRDCACDHNSFDSEFASCEFADEYEDEADDYMNEKYHVPGHYWRRNDGDWGLWGDEEED
jgi:hypothetical protein